MDGWPAIMVVLFSGTEVRDGLFTARRRHNEQVGEQGRGMGASCLVRGMEKFSGR